MIPQAIRQTIVDMNYGWTNPTSIIVLIPVVSLIFQHIQKESFLKILNANYQQVHQIPAAQTSHEFIKLDKLHTWHRMGHMIQGICSVALAALYPPLLMILPLSVYGMSVSYHGTIHEFNMKYGRVDWR